MKVLLSGASGLVGSRLLEELREHGYQVETLHRQDFETPVKETGKLENAFAVVHLAGESIAAHRWNDSVKKKIRDSRVLGTRNLVSSFERVLKKPKVFVCASAVGIYGNTGNRSVDETAMPASDFLAEVCTSWEKEARSIENLGIRSVQVRLGIVLSQKGGMLQKLILPAKWGLQGPIGTGEQYISWISIDDVVMGFRYCLENPQLKGPINLCAPEPVTNLEFSRALAKHLKRPVGPRIPPFLMKLALGQEAAEALVLKGTRVMPKKLQDAGFKFKYARLDDAFHHILQ